LVVGALPAVATTVPSTIFVDHNVTCSDTAASRGTLALPFCTIQAAANTALPGQTVQIDPTEPHIGFTDRYFENLALTRSGTPGEPITLSGGGSGDPSAAARVFVNGPVSGTRLSVALAGVHDVTLDGIGFTADPTTLVTVSNSSDITLSRDRFEVDVENAAANLALRVSGSSDHVTVTKDTMIGLNTGIVIGAGVSDTVIADNDVALDVASAVPSVSGITVTGASGTVITNNTISSADPVCVRGLTVTGGSKATSVENNILGARCASAPLVSVSADSIAGTTEDYNILHTATPDPQLYSWAGTSFPTTAAFQTATGEGAHDLDADPQLSGRFGMPAATIVADSANPDAPDTPTTDITGAARVDDPLAPNTQGAIIDRGALEMHDSLQPRLSLSATHAPTGGTVFATASVDSSWAPVTAYTIDFDDGTTVPVPVDNPSTSHVFTKPGLYAVGVTATDALGTVAQVDTLGNPTPMDDIEISAPQPPVARITAGAAGGQGAVVRFDQSSDSWNFVGMTCDWGDGSAPETHTFPDLCPTHNYARLGTYTITVTMHDAGGNDASGTATVTTAGSRFVPLHPTRLLDTRTGTGTGGRIAKVLNGGTLTLKVAGVGSIPADAKAVALNVTVANPATGGDVGVFAHGATVNGTSTVNFVAGQTVPNPTIVALGTGGAVDLSVVGGPVDLVADVTGYFESDPDASGYTTMTSHRLLDTRNGTGTGGRVAPIPANGTQSLAVAGDGVPASGVTAVALNVTVTGPKSGGFITAFPDGTARPGTSNVNFVAGQTVANLVIVPVGADGKVDFTNSSPGASNLVADIVGYFHADGGDTYVPVLQERTLDTRFNDPIAPRSTLQTTVTALAAADLKGGVVMNVTATSPTQAGFVLEGPSPLPNGLTQTASTLNWDRAGQTVANLAIVSSPTGSFSVFNGSDGTTNVLNDILGYFDPATPQP
jgi:PKD repeat protein